MSSQAGSQIMLISKDINNNTNNISNKQLLDDQRPPIAPNKEEYANCLSKTTYYWMNALFSLGQSRQLDEKDMPDLREMDKALTLNKRFHNAWKQEEGDAKIRLQQYQANQQQKQQKQKQKQQKPEIDQELGKVKPEDNKANKDNKGKSKAKAESVEDGRVRLGRVLRIMFGFPFFVAGIAKLFNDSLGFTTPIILNYLLRYLEDTESVDYPRWFGYFLAALIAVTLMMKSTVENYYFYQVNRISMQVRKALTDAVYEKSLRLSNAARNTSTTGEIVNYMQLDANRLSTLVLQLHVMWSGLFQIIGYLTQLFFYIGPSALAGVATMPFLVILQGYSMKKQAMFRKEQLKYTDERVKLTNEMIQGIRAIKMYSWEESFQNRIEKTRAGELDVIRRSSFFRAINSAIISCSPTAILIVTFLFYSLVAKKEMVASTVFTTIAIFERLRFPIMFYPGVITQFAEAQVALKRLNAYMAKEEVDKKSDEQTNNNNTDNTDNDKDNDKVNNKNNNKDYAVIVNNSSFYWNANIQALSDVSLQLKSGTLNAVVGPVGSGKTALCLSLLNELITKGEKPTINGKVAYVAQSPWILNETLRDNILFGSPYDEDRYEHVLQVCNLLPDLQILPKGDLTEIGERGINLSGGQKQRVSIARAAYSSADVFIFDDPLSALDPQVAREVFSECICKHLANKTRVMVTNQLYFLSQADNVIVIDSKQLENNNKNSDNDNTTTATVATNKPTNGAANGAANGATNAAKEQKNVAASVGFIREQGSYALLMSNGLDFANMMKKHGAEDHKDSNAAAKTNEGEQKNPKKSLVKSASILNIEAQKRGPGGNLITKEEREQGAVSKAVYLSYFTASKKVWIAVMCLALYLLAPVAEFFATWWLSYWSKQSKDANSASPSPGVGFYIGIYAIFGVGMAIVSYARGVVVVIMCLHASKTLHENLLSSILKATSTFFDTTPVGRIIARFSKDMDQIDNMLSMNINFTLLTVISVCSSLLIIVIIIPLFGTVILPLIILYSRMMNYYRQVCRELKRLDSVTRSPIYANFSTTLGGLSTIRAYHVEARFIDINNKVNDANDRAFWMLKMSDRWLSMRLELMGNIVIFAAAIFAVLNRGALYAGLAGLSLNYAMSVTNLLGWTVRSFAETESQMNSVERVLHYTNNIDHEKPRIIDDHRPPKHWPLQGQVHIRNLQVRYRAGLDLVLKGLNVDVESSNKIGVVGRTGCGKSTLMLSLLRLIEPTNGYIEIDGVNIHEIGLKDLRSRLSIIPQDPVLFSGTVRFNLDPEETATDAELWETLEKINMKNAIMELKDKLNHKVAEYGENFSAGQRQLMCLGRAIIRKSKILLLDEATSSVDFESDQLVQNLIRKEFAQCTIFTIAHRINTIIDSDKILLLKDGEVVEFDHPGVLLSNPNSMFSSMVNETGAASAAALKRIASAKLA